VKVPKGEDFKDRLLQDDSVSPVYEKVSGLKIQLFPMKPFSTDTKCDHLPTLSILVFIDPKCNLSSSFFYLHSTTLVVALGNDISSDLISI